MQALDDLKPAAVLIEGPSEASELLPMLADPDMATPVALLIYAEDDPANASFFPFAEYSPEYQAARWAVRNGAALRFIDLPASDRLGVAGGGIEDETAASADDDPISRDPIGALATAAGYEDGEAWWSDVIEENPASGPVFAAVADAMTALRAESKPLSPARGRARGAYADRDREDARRSARARSRWSAAPGMCRRCRSVAASRPIANCSRGGRRRRSRRPGRRGPRRGWRAASGYGAGVVAPGWCAHLWATRDGADRGAVWLARVAYVLRDRGHFVSTASVIEAQRLGTALAALRDRPAPGFEELREAAIACLCGGERALWDDVAAELLIGAGVGMIPAATPLAPLLEDLQRQQKATRLKPEALERELTLDLRSESGLMRSTLLHRLNALDVPWGRLTDAGRSRGTFRENWQLRWEPEFAVRLVEKLIYGSTIAEAAGGRLMEAMRGAAELGALATLVRNAMIADLPRATEFGIAALEEKAALTSDCEALLAALPPMADILRYGEARAGTVEHLAALMPRIVVQAALALPYAARNLDAAAAGKLRGAILAADSAIQLAQLEADVVAGWRDALQALLRDNQATRLVAGTAARLLYEVELLTRRASRRPAGADALAGHAGRRGGRLLRGLLRGRRPAADP